MSDDVIYVPKGAAREYAELALNLYDGCPHGCEYCYAPACLHRTRTEFHAKATPRNGILARLERDAVKLDGDPRRVLLCFTCDPYPACETQHGLTRAALEILGTHNLHARVLTKNGELAGRDFAIMARDRVEFGCTVCFASERLREEWEPGAPSIASRMTALAHARACGIRTWVSVEPVIVPGEALHVMELMARYVDVWKIGKLNHMAVPGLAVDWRQFLRLTLEWCERTGARYQIKDALWAHADDAIRARWPKENLR